MFFSIVAARRFRKPFPCLSRGYSINPAGFRGFATACDRPCTSSLTCRSWTAPGGRAAAAAASKICSHISDSILRLARVPNNSKSRRHAGRRIAGAICLCEPVGCSFHPTCVSPVLSQFEAAAVSLNAAAGGQTPQGQTPRFFS